MPRCLLASIAALVLTTLCSAQAPFAPGDVLVCPAPARSAAVTEHLASLGLEIAETDRVSGVMRVAVPVGTEGAWSKRLHAHRDIEYAETNGIGSGGLVPNDTHYAVQWQLENTGQSNGTPGADIRATDAWDLTTGSASTVIAVLDTGIDTDHLEFAGRIDPNGWDFVNNDNDPEDDHSHGSRVSGVMCANANNNFSVVGVDWQCKVLPLKVLNQNNGGTTFNLAQALNYCTTQPQVQIISMSLINYPGNATLINALQAARNANKILLACAGNGGIGNANTSYPGASPLTISIGATTHTDARANFSGTGSALDFVAPGANVITVVYDSNSDSWASVSGCSFATPITAGIVGLMHAYAAQLSLPPLTQQDVYDALVLGSVDLGTPGRDDFFGHGRLDARNALEATASLANCNNGTVGAGLGGPFDVIFVNGQARQGLQRRITVPANIPFQVSVDVPPSNPQPSAVAPFFIMWGTFGDQSTMTPYQLPLGIGELCFDPSSPLTFVQVSGVAPYTTTVPALPPQITASLQGAIFDTPQAHIAVTNLVTWETQTAPPPVINQVQPGAAAPNAAVTISGTGFLPGLVLRVAGNVTPTLSVSPTAVTFANPASLGCDTSLSITNLDSQIATAPFNISPVLTQVIGIPGLPAAGGTTLLLTGQNFVPGSTVTIGGNPMTISLISSQVINGILPPGQIGPATIIITTPYSCTTTGTLTYTP